MKRTAGFVLATGAVATALLMLATDAPTLTANEAWISLAVGALGFSTLLAGLCLSLGGR